MLQSKDHTAQKTMMTMVITVTAICTCGDKFIAKSRGLAFTVRCHPWHFQHKLPRSCDLTTTWDKIKPMLTPIHKMLKYMSSDKAERKAEKMFVPMNYRHSLLPPQLKLRDRRCTFAKETVQVQFILMYFIQQYHKVLPFSCHLYSLKYGSRWESSWTK